MTANTPGSGILSTLRSVDGMGIVRLEGRFDTGTETGGQRSPIPIAWPAGKAT
jgi:hypothetical protein